ncbi:hypothetical protein [Oceanobacillus picturae]|uniref:hypothetical protein n=1 Tax=Oceanobacillus picturae TaxID=171693 RepID=UPI00363F6408
MFKGNIEKVLGIMLILLLAFNFFFLLHINNSVGEKQGQLEEKLAVLSNQIEALQEDSPKTEKGNTDSTIDFLKQEYANYKDFANSNRESFINLVSLFFVALGVLVTGGTIVLYWIFGQTKTEVKENANLTIKSSIKEIEEEAKSKIKSLIDPKMEDFEEKYRELERFMENQHSLRKSRVLVLSPENKKEEMERLELMRIREIVGEAQLITLDDFEEFEQKIDNKEVDILVYRYEKKEGDMQEETIRGYIQSLKDRDSKIPVVVYAKPGNLVDKEDGKFVDSYPYAVMANLPTTLTSNMISLAGVLSYERR